MEGVGSGAGGVGAGATPIGDGVGAAAAPGAGESGWPGASATDALCARQTKVNPKKHTRPRAITLDIVVHTCSMGDPLTFSPINQDLLFSFEIRHKPVDQQDDITGTINHGQTNRFCSVNKNGLAKDNFSR
jgi:hypothetical protein